MFHCRVLKGLLLNSNQGHMTFSHLQISYSTDFNVNWYWRLEINIFNIILVRVVSAQYKTYFA